MMRILYIATSFPEPTKGATIYTDLAEALHEAGHEMTIVVAEETKNKRNTELKQERGFNVLRIVTGNYHDVALIEKGLTTMKIPVLMRLGIQKYLKDKLFDLILFEAPPVTNYRLIKWAKRLFNCSAYLMLKDIFPQNAVDLGIFTRSSLPYLYFKTCEKKLLRTADYIGCMSPANMKYVLEHNPWLDPKKVEIFPNTKQVTDSLDSNDSFPIRQRYGIPKQACVFLFGGNMGKPQYIDLLCTAIMECKDEAGIYFLFVGRGTDRYKLEQTIKRNAINNALLVENLPRMEYEQITKECDVGLITLDPRFTIPNYPSRILSYMEYAKPVLAATDKATDVRELIEDAQCGEWVWSGDSQTFVNTLKEMASYTDLLVKGLNGRRYMNKNFRVEHSVEILERHFWKVERGQLYV